MPIFSAWCTSKTRLDGKIAVITGANTGIGKETARDFYRRGARVILACRNVEKAKAAIEDIKCNPFPSYFSNSRKMQTADKNGLGDLEVYSLDLCNFKSVKECAKKLMKEPAIHILVNNAGIMFTPYQITEDGFEIQLQSNYLGHFLLTLLLLPKMQSSTPGCRIINVSSRAHIFGKIHFSDINLKKSWWYIRPWKAYFQSKLANILFTKELARRLKGARVILACRNIEKATAAIEDIKCNPFPRRMQKIEDKNGLGDLEVCSLDLCSFKSVKECAKKLMKEPAIHILVNNAGIMFAPYQITEDGFEIQLQSNYLGHFLLTLLLLPKMQSSTPGCRIINVSSLAHIYGKIHLSDINLERSWWYFRPWKAYFQSKLANILFTKELARQLKEAKISGINVYSLHPGVIKTELSREFHSTIVPGATFFFNYIMRPFIKNAEQGAQTTIYCAIDEKTANETGLYYSECCVTNPKGVNDQKAQDLWNYTCFLLRLETNENFSTLLETVTRQLDK
ncbi:retinol dehydrogenase 11 isoform X2 [Monomorium pharaonis]|uniref:retinol dehydrogenase 11 isoform X2 n=1 Tax=Monomorium pharaonis TaxID=307658 RepID=UPI0017467A56|nr:retinol dehydrogenase 11 isoform X2 [Monomorium pharaonis]